VRELPHFSTPSALIVLVMRHFRTPNGAPRMAKQHFVLMGNGVPTHTATARARARGREQVGQVALCRVVVVVIVVQTSSSLSNEELSKEVGNASLRILAPDDGVKRCSHTRSGRVHALRFSILNARIERSRAPTWLERERNGEREREGVCRSNLLLIGRRKGIILFVAN